MKFSVTEHFKMLITQHLKMLVTPHLKIRCSLTVDFSALEVIARFAHHAFVARARRATRCAHVTQHLKLLVIEHLQMLVAQHLKVLVT